MKTKNEPDKPKDRAWGVGIAVFYSAFVLITLGLVFFATLQRFDLVADNYYEEGVKYQQRIDQKKLAESPEYRIDVNYDRSARGLEISFPTTISVDSISGNIVLFRPSNAALDRRWGIDLDSESKQLIDLREVQRGSWKVMVYWKAGSSELYTERSIFVQ